LLSRGANIVARTLLGLRAHDCTAGFRCYRSEVLATIDLNAIKADGYSYLIEMLFWCQRMGFTIGEVPIVFVDRRHGASKISKQEIFKAGFTVLRLAFARWRYALTPPEVGPLGQGHDN
ncbi:MAG: polyprenol monophosphomannose synthase, partial [Anaerolineae bacterium]|nr:polyprenol monophosphomannose synthase [Anaerolineae bacterium]